MKRSVDFGAMARAVFFALTPAFAAGGSMGLPVLISLAGGASLRPSLLRQAVEKKPAWLALLLLLLGWAVLSSLWSAHQGPTALKLAILVSLGLMFAAGASAGLSAARLALAGAIAAFAVLWPLLAIEAFAGLPLNRAAAPELPLGEVNRNPSRGAVVLLALSWPTAAALLDWGGRRRTWAALAVLAAAGVMSLQFGQLATALAFAAGAGAFLLGLAAPRAAVRLLSAGLALWMLAAPFATPLITAIPRLGEIVPLSWAARIGIWDYTCARIMEQLWIGHGLDASRAVSEHILIRGELNVRAISVHPHSASLQIWYETGFVGALLAAAAIVVGGWTLSRALAGNRPAGAAAAASFATLGLIANVSFSLWQEWWLASLFIAAALVGALVVRGARA